MEPSFSCAAPRRLGRRAIWLPRSRPTRDRPGALAGALETGESPLTPRETDVLRAADSGLSTEEIAKQLFLSSATVRNYLSNAIAKVGGHNRIDAIRIARDAGWL
jgi:two-component system, NarL family, response regulator DesR